MSASRPDSRSVLLRDCGLLLMLPLLLVWLNDHWLYNYAGWGDQWIYFGNHLDLPRKAREYSDSYRSMRLAWNVPGYLLYSWLPAGVALHVLHLGMMAIALLSFYVLALRVASRRAAVVTTALLATYPMFVTAMGWDYVDGACIAYLLASSACAATAATAQRPRAWSLLSGAAFAASAYTYPFSVLYAPVLLLILHGARNRDFSPRFLRAAAHMVLGAAALTLLLCVLSRLLGGKFLFMLPALAFGRTITGELVRSDVYGIGSVDWLARAPWLVLPFCVFAASCWTICRRALATRPAADSGAAAALLVAWALLFAVFAIADFGLRVGVLRTGFYSNLLIPAMFLAMAILLRGVLEGLSARGFALTLAAAAGAGLLALAPQTLALGAALAGPGLWLVALLFVPLGLGRRLGSEGRTVTALAACIGAGLLWACVANWHPQVFYEAAPSKKDVFAASWKAIRAAQEIWPRGKYRFWYSEADPLTKIDFYGSLTMATTVSTESIVSDKFPTDGDFIPGYMRFHLEAGTRLIIISDSPDPIGDAAPVLRKHGLSARPVAVRDIAAGAIRFKMHFVTLGALR